MTPEDATDLSRHLCSHILKGKCRVEEVVRGKVRGHEGGRLYPISCGASSSRKRALGLAGVQGISLGSFFNP